MDTLDQLEEAIYSIKDGAPPVNTTAEFAFVVYISGRWHPGTFYGRPTACNEHIERTLRVRLDDPSIRWARGHVGDNGQFIIHPANDRDAVHTLTRLLQSKLRRR